MPSTSADGHDPWPAGRHDDRADPVATEDGEPRHGRCDVDRQIGLPPSDGPEVEAAGSVDQDCDVEVALLDRIPDVRFARPGKDRPVHPADVVARLVGSCLSGLDTVAEHERSVTAVSATDHPVAHRQLDTAEPCRQVETGTRCGRHLAAGGSPGRTIGGVCADAPVGVPTAVTGPCIACGGWAYETVSADAAGSAWPEATCIG